MLTVTLFNPNPQNGELEDGTEFEVDYVSLFNSETFGPPPLVAPGKDQRDPRAREGDKVLYINTNLVPAFSILREGD